MAGGLKGGFSLPRGQVAKGQGTEAGNVGKAGGGLAALYSSTEVLTRRINFLPAKSADAHSLISTKLIPLNSPVQLPASPVETVRGSAGKEQAASDGGGGSQAGSLRPRNGDASGSGKPKAAGGDPEILLTWKDIRGVGAGLSNMGNTCFLNSVLQCLAYTPPLVHFLETGRHHTTCRQGGFCALCELRKHVLKALATPRGVVGPTALVRGLRSLSRSFRPGRQEDAHEYLLHLLEAMHKACLPPQVARNPAAAAKADSWLQRCFGGKLRSQVQCSVCSLCSSTADPFLDLSLDIHRADSVLRALQRFTQPEVLDGDNKYRCSRCQKKVRAHKRFLVEAAPPVLTLQLKRFSAVTGGKIDKWVQYAPQLDLRPFVTPDQHGAPLEYSLYAVLVHAGWSTHSGHYFCFVRTAAGIWHAMDDSRVRQVSEKTVLEQKAYMLFYIRKGPANPQPAPPATSKVPAGKPGMTEASPSPGAQPEPGANKQRGEAAEGQTAGSKSEGAQGLQPAKAVELTAGKLTAKDKDVEMTEARVGKAAKTGAPAVQVNTEAVEVDGRAGGSGSRREASVSGKAAVAGSREGSRAGPQKGAADDLGVRVERKAGAEGQGEGRRLAGQKGTGAEDPSGAEQDEEEEGGAVLLAEGDGDDEEVAEDRAGEGGEDESRAARGAQSNEVGTSGRELRSSGRTLVGEEGEESAEMWDEYYRQKAGTAWPRTSRALMQLLLTMPKTRRYFWGLGVRAMGFRRRKRRSVMAEVLRELSREVETELGEVVIPGRRMTRGLTAQLLGRDGGKGEDPQTPQKAQPLGTSEEEEELGANTESAGKVKNRAGKKAKRHREGTDVDAGGDGKKHRRVTDGRQQVGEEDEGRSSGEGVQEPAQSPGTVGKAGPRLIHFHENVAEEEEEISLKAWTLAEAEVSNGAAPGGSEEEEESSEEEDEREDAADGEEDEEALEDRGQGGKLDAQEQTSKQAKGGEQGARPGGRTPERETGRGGTKVRGAAAIQALARPAGTGLFEFDVPQWDAAAGEREERAPRGKAGRTLGIKWRRYDQWDAELDKGRVKKVKNKAGLDAADEEGGRNNLFQESVAARRGGGERGRQDKTARRKATKNKRLHKKQNRE